MILNYDDIVTSRDFHSTKQKLPLVDFWYVALTKFKFVSRSYIQFSNCTLLGIQQLVIQQTQQEVEGKDAVSIRKVINL